MSKEQAAWLIEIRSLPFGPHWLYMDASEWKWTNDASKAMKFADRQSAEQVAEDCEEDIVILEHLWPMGF